MTNQTETIIIVSTPETEIHYPIGQTTDTAAIVRALRELAETLEQAGNQAETR